MFVEVENISAAKQILQSGISALKERPKLSELDQNLLELLSDAQKMLNNSPYEPYNSIGEAVKNYVQLRDMLGENRKAWEAFESRTKDEMERISMFLRDKGDDLGVDSFNTPYGTAYRNRRESYRVENWNEFAPWLLSTGNIQCVEKRAAKLAVKEILDETGELPPGLIMHVEVEFNVRRASKG